MSERRPERREEPKPFIPQRQIGHFEIALRKRSVKWTAAGVLLVAAFVVNQCNVDRIERGQTPPPTVTNNR